SRSLFDGDWLCVTRPSHGVLMRFPFLFFSHDPAPTGSYTLSLHDALPIYVFGRGFEELLACVEAGVKVTVVPGITSAFAVPALRSEEHTSELQSRENLVCRLLLEKKNHTHHPHVGDHICRLELLTRLECRW